MSTMNRNIAAFVIMSAGFGTVFYVNWRIGIGLTLVFWASWIYKSIEDEQRSQKPD